LLLGDFSQAKVVYVYMLPRMFDVIWKKIQNECQNGVQLVFYDFPLRYLQEEKKVIVPIP
jgi:hypothetical protein